MHEQLSKCSRNVLLVLSEFQLTTNLYQDILSVISYAVSGFLLEWRTADMDIEMIPNRQGGGMSESLKIWRRTK